MEFYIREGGKKDLPFLKEMLYFAAFWQIADGIDNAKIPNLPDDPQISIIFHEWGKSGDIAFIAENEDGQQIGAAWYRFYTLDAHSYGFIDSDIPEIGIAVKPDFRGSGVGTAILKRLIEKAAKRNIRALSLSVERNNYAAELYKKFEFVNIGNSADSHWTMMLKI